MTLANPVIFTVIYCFCGYISKLVNCRPYNCAALDIRSFESFYSGTIKFLSFFNNLFYIIELCQQRSF